MPILKSVRTQTIESKKRTTVEQSSSQEGESSSEGQPPEKNTESLYRLRNHGYYAYPCHRSRRQPSEVQNKSVQDWNGIRVCWKESGIRQVVTRQWLGVLSEATKEHIDFLQNFHTCKRSKCRTDESTGEYQEQNQSKGRRLGSWTWAAFFLIDRGNVPYLRGRFRENPSEMGYGNEVFGMRNISSMVQC